MRILFIYHRDIHPQDGGASRTIVSRMNFLVSECGVDVFTNFNILSEADPLIKQLSCDGNSLEELKGFIVEHCIDILDIPEGELLTSLARKSVQGTNCKIVTEFHSKPGYECLNLRTSINNWAKLSISNRVVSYFKLAFLPLYKAYVKKKLLINFQNASLLADRLVVLADSFIQEYKNVYNLPNAENIVAIGNPLSFSTFADEKQIETKDKTILIVSRLDETSKRISIAIKAWAILEKQYSDWEIVIIGDGESEQLYRNMVAKLGLKRITLCGHQTPESYYEKASIFLMTSAFEGFPMVLLEALQKGCVPIVMNSYSALSYIINDGQDGFITPNNDINSFVDKIKILIECEDCRKKMAMTGVDNCRRFSIENVGKQWLDLYEGIISK